MRKKAKKYQWIPKLRGVGSSSNGNSKKAEEDLEFEKMLKEMKINGEKVNDQSFEDYSDDNFFEESYEQSPMKGEKSDVRKSNVKVLSTIMMRRASSLGHLKKMI